jgi:hypothetical protein
MVLDSSGRPDDERGKAVAETAPSARFEVGDRNPMEVADYLGHRF